MRIVSEVSEQNFGLHKQLEIPQHLAEMYRKACQGKMKKNREWYSRLYANMQMLFQHRIQTLVVLTLYTTVSTLEMPDLYGNPHERCHWHLPTRKRKPSSKWRKWNNKKIQLKVHCVWYVKRTERSGHVLIIAA